MKQYDETAISRLVYQALESIVDELSSDSRTVDIANGYVYEGFTAYGVGLLDETVGTNECLFGWIKRPVKERLLMVKQPKKGERLPSVYTYPSYT